MTIGFSMKPELKLMQGASAGDEVGGGGGDDDDDDGDDDDD